LKRHLTRRESWNRYCHPAKANIYLSWTFARFRTGKMAHAGKTAIDERCTTKASGAVATTKVSGGNECANSR